MCVAVRVILETCTAIIDFVTGSHRSLRRAAWSDLDKFSMEEIRAEIQKRVGNGLDMDTLASLDPSLNTESMVEAFESLCDFACFSSTIISAKRGF